MPPFLFLSQSQNFLPDVSPPQHPVRFNLHHQDAISGFLAKTFFCLSRDFLEPRPIWTVQTMFGQFKRRGRIIPKYMNYSSKFSELALVYLFLKTSFCTQHFDVIFQIPFAMIKISVERGTWLSPGKLPGGLCLVI